MTLCLHQLKINGVFQLTISSQILVILCSRYHNYIRYSTCNMGCKQIRETLKTTLYTYCVIVWSSQNVSSTSTSSEHALELTALAEMLGIPIDEDVGPKREKMPEYLETVYRCWSNSDNCDMPEATSDANVVRSFLGYGECH